MSIMPQLKEFIDAKAANALVVAPRNRAEIAKEYARQHHPAWVYLASLQSRHSRETMRDRLNLATAIKGSTIESFPWATLDFAQVQSLRSDLEFDENGEPRAHTTVNLTLSAIRGVLKTAWKLGLMEGEQYHRARSVPNLKGSRMPPGRVMENDEIERLRTAFHTTPGAFGAMLCGLFGVFIGAGLRREEVCRLPITALRNRTLRVIGKGNKERAIPLGKEPLFDLETWIAMRSTLRVPHESMFVRVREGDHVVPTHGIGTDTMDRIIRPWARRGLPSNFAFFDKNGNENPFPPITPHDLRRTFITRLLDNGVDVITVQRLAGHESSKTTERYDRRGEKAAEHAIDTKGVY